MSTRLSRGQRLGGMLILAAQPFCIGGLWWWPLCIPGVLLLYFGFMLSCFA